MSQPQIGQKLCLVNRKQLFGCFGFHNDFILDHQVKSVSTIKLHFFVSNGKRFLFFNSEAKLPELKYQARLVCRFQKAWPQMPMNLNRGAYDAARDLIEPIDFQHFSAISASLR